ncbi:MAG: glycosyltransferase [Deltaproteobacteria bacterium]|nr:glycosyltransferase [Deltaproteobacteria bacterium]
MIRVDQLIGNLPSDLADVTPMALPPPCEGEVKASVEKALRFYVRDLSSLRAAIVVGSHGMALIRAMQAACPSIARFLVLEPDPSALRALLMDAESAREAGPTLDKIFIGDVLRPCTGCSTDAYVETCEFLLQERLPLSQVAVYVHRESVGRGSGVYEPIVAALDDLFWSNSQVFASVAIGADQTTVPFFEQWADYLAASGQPFHALKFYYLMRNQVEASRLSSRVIRCWVNAGHFEPMLEWLDSLRMSNEERSILRRDIEKAVEEARATRRAQLDKNLDALKERHPNLHELLANYQPCEEIHDALVADSRWVIRPEQEPVVGNADRALFFTKKGDRLLELNALSNPKPLHDALLEASDKDEIGEILIGSLRRYDVLLNLLRNRPTTNFPNFQQAIYVVEESLDFFHALLSTVDLAACLKEERITWFIGPNAREDVVRFFRDNPMQRIPEFRVNVDQALEAQLDATLGQLIARADAVVRSYPTLYGPSYPQELCDVLNGRAKRPLRVLFPTSRFTDVVQYCARDLAEGFRALGAETLIIKEESSTERMSALAVAEKIGSFRPDLVVLLDHLRPEKLSLIPSCIPVATWIQDDLPWLEDGDAIRQLGPLDFAFALYAPWVTKFRALGYPHVEHLPNAANTAIYRRLDPEPTKTIDVAYITNLIEVGQGPSGVPGLYEWLERAIVTRDDDVSDIDFCTNLLREAKEELRFRIDFGGDHLLNYVWQLRRRLNRQKILSWLVDACVPVALYGRGWEKDPRFAGIARGPVKPGEELADVYRRSKIVLQVNEHHNCHQRVFEAIASGACVVARRTPVDETPGELSSCLSIGSQIHMFSNREELLSLTWRLLDDEDLRRRTIESASPRVHSEHTYVSRVRKILAAVREGVERVAHSKAAA